MVFGSDERERYRIKEIHLIERIETEKRNRKETRDAESKKYISSRELKLKKLAISPRKKRALGIRP
jgi:hypothetical protein